MEMDMDDNSDVRSDSALSSADDDSHPKAAGSLTHASANGSHAGSAAPATAAAHAHSPAPAADDSLRRSVTSLRIHLPLTKAALTSDSDSRTNTFNFRKLAALHAAQLINSVSSIKPVDPNAAADNSSATVSDSYSHEQTRAVAESLESDKAPALAVGNSSIHLEDVQDSDDNMNGDASASNKQPNQPGQPSPKKKKVSLFNLGYTISQTSC
eukprot:jgi/Hompol1/4331/HPOL_003621-RA